jgi:uncharacterized protein YndB with AHSA1/START domain
VSESVDTKTHEVQVETTIAVAPDAVWKALTDDIGLWWPSEFYSGGQEGARSYHLEAKPGGRMYEEWEGGGGLQWGQVWTVDPGKKLQITGLSFPEWGGPAVFFGTWTLTAEGDGCKLHFSESTLGKTSAGYRAEKEKGWSFLFDGVLKAHLEGTEAPKWED